MCDIGHGIAQKSFNDGILKTLLENVKNLIKNTGWSLEHSFNTLAISQEDRQKIIEMMKNTSKA